jgi:hypothetical protein
MLGILPAMLLLNVQVGCLHLIEQYHQTATGWADQKGGPPPKRQTAY